MLSTQLQIFLYIIASSYIFDSLSTIQNFCIKLVLEAFGTSFITSLLSEVLEPVLDIRRQLTSANSTLYIFSSLHFHYKIKFSLSSLALSLTRSVYSFFVLKKQYAYSTTL